MRFLIFGRTGQVATELGRVAPKAIRLGRNTADLSVPSDCARIIGTAEVDAVINAAAWTAVDAAERHRDEAFTINADAPGAMARACADRGVPLVHISTDYVFDGSGETSWRPVDTTAPLGAYGASKLAGEEAIRTANGSHAILRTSWVFSAHGGNFVKTMLRLATERSELSIVADQVGGPTPADAIALACIQIAKTLVESPEKSGSYHLSGAPDVSWAEFARQIFAEAERGTIVRDIRSSEYPTPAPRPLNSRLDCTATWDVFGIERPDWREGLRRVLKEVE